MELPYRQLLIAPYFDLSFVLVKGQHIQRLLELIATCNRLPSWMNKMQGVCQVCLSSRSRLSLE